MFVPALSLLTLPVLATAARVDDLADCTQQLDLQRAIEGCTRIAEDGGLPDRQLAMAFNNRGNAYETLDQVDQALADPSLVSAVLRLQANK